MPSRSELLSTNAPLSDADLDSMTDLRARGKQRFEYINRSILAMQEALESLLREREELRGNIEEYNAILHPIRRFPTEILTDIFLSFAKEGVEDLYGKTSLAPSGMPWRLAQVSNRWRKTALALPRLWSSVGVLVTQEDLQNPLKTQRLVYHLGVQLHRSAVSPLSVSIFTTSHIEEYHPLFALLLPSSPRWKQLCVHMPVPTFNSISRIQGLLQSLDTLFVVACPGNTPFAPPVHPGNILSSPLSDMFRWAPELRTVVGNAGILRSCSLPWSQIVDFRHHAGSASGSSSTRSLPLETLELLRFMPNIEHCRDLNVSPYSDDAPRPESAERIELLRLRSLSVKFHGDSHGLLEHLVTPSLQSLQISCSVGDFTDSLLTLLSLHKHSNGLDRPQLTFLTIKSLSFSDENCVRLLEELPDLQTFHLECKKTLTKELFVQLSQRTELAPKLEVLYIKASVELIVELEESLSELKEARPGLWLTRKKV